MDILVETFDVDVGADGTTHTLTNAGSATSAMMIRHNNASLKFGAGPTGITGNQDPNDLCVGFELTDTSTITFRRGNLSTLTKAVGEVWRYDGSPGGANEFINRGIYQLNVSTLSTSQAVAGIVNEADCVPILLGVTTNQSGRNNTADCVIGVRMDGLGNVVASRNKAGVATTAFVQVIEFTGSNWTVASATSSSHDTADETVSLSQSIGSWDNAWIEASMEGDTAEDGLSDTECCFVPGPSTSQITCALHAYGDGNARNDGSAFMYAIHNPDINVYREAGSNNIAEGNGAYGTAAWPTGAPTDRSIDHLALQWFVDTTGTGTAYGRGCLGARITDPAGTITHWVHRSGNNVGSAYAVIDLSALDDSGGGVALTVDGLAQDHALAVVAITQQHFLTPGDADQSQATDEPTLTEHGNLSPLGLSQEHEVDAATLAQQSSLSVDEAAQTAAVDGITLTQAGSISPAEVDQQQDMDATALTQAHGMTVESVDQLQALGITGLTQAYAISLDPVAQDIALGGVTLSSAGLLGTHNVSQDSSLDALTLFAAYNLACDDVDQDATLDVATLQADYSLQIQSLLQEHTIGEVLLQAGLLPDNVAQDIDLEQATYTTVSVLSLGDLTQTQLVQSTGYSELIFGKLNGRLALVASGEVAIYLALNGEVRHTAALTASSLKTTH